jgi:hypothetical protein
VQELFIARDQRFVQTLVEDVRGARRGDSLN